MLDNQHIILQGPREAHSPLFLGTYCQYYMCTIIARNQINILCQVDLQIGPESNRYDCQVFSIINQSIEAQDFWPEKEIYIYVYLSINAKSLRQRYVNVSILIVVNCLVGYIVYIIHVHVIHVCANF